MPSPSRGRRRARGRSPPARPADRARPRTRPRRRPPRGGARSPRAPALRPGCFSTATTSPASQSPSAGAAAGSRLRSPSRRPDDEPGQLRTAALRPDPARQRAFSSTCSTRYAPGMSVGSSSISPRTSRTTVSGGSLWARMRTASFAPQLTPPGVGDPVRVGRRFQGRLGRRLPGTRRATSRIPSASRRRIVPVKATARSSPAARTS